MKSKRYLISKRALLTTLLMILSVLLVGLNTAEVYASPNASYLPAGKNYLEEENFSYNTTTLSSDDDIKVKPSTWYTITVPELLENPSIVIYGNSADYVDGEDGYEFSFLTEIDETAISITIYDQYISLYMTQYGFDFFQLEEGQSVTAYEEYIAPVVDTIPPFIDGVVAMWLSNVDTPDSYESIKALLTATDNTDGDITAGIETVSNAYTGNESILGEYDIVFRSTDSTGNSTTVTSTIRVVDIVDPIVNLIGVAEVYLEYGDTYIPQTCTATDNYDGVIAPAYGTGDFDETQLDTYIMGCQATDSSGNISQMITWNVTVQDTTAPVMTVNGSLTTYVEFGGNYTELGATSLDNYNGVLPVVITGSYNISILGTYELYYDVTDANGNVADTIVRSIVVRDTTAPIITAVSSFQFTTNQQPSLDYVMKDMTASDIYEGVMSENFVITLDEYTGNEATLGIYNVTFTVTDSSGNTATHSFTIDIVDDEKPVFSTSGRFVTKEYADSLDLQGLKDYFANLTP